MERIDKREAWLSCVCEGKNERDKDLLRRASDLLDFNIYREECPWQPKRGIVPSHYLYKGVWNWDCAFHAVGVKYWDAELAYEQCEIFWETQLETGKFIDVWYADGGVGADFTKPPVFPWAFESVYRKCPDRKRLERGYDAYVKNESFWCNYRKKKGLFFYTCDVEPVNEAWAKCESGWDTSVRFDGGISNLWSIDLNCYMINVYRSLQFMARELGLPEDCKKWQEKENELADLIREKLWDPEQGAFCDVYYEDETPSKVLTPASFMPLFVSVATKEQAEAMHEIYKKHFYPAMPSVSYLDKEYTSEDYWRGPLWLNIAYFAYKGLKNYGFTDTAEKGKELILDWCDKEKSGIYEYYDSKTGKGLNALQYGWTATFIIEFILNF
ncbi:MAG: hypothetical protein IKD04_08295 [Clostridia bacterium]|nr:hypothetical protein [Clostridia bacterium]